MKKEGACKKTGEVLTQIRLDLNAILLLCKEHQENNTFWQDTHTLSWNRNETVYINNNRSALQSIKFSDDFRWKSGHQTALNQICVGNSFESGNSTTVLQTEISNISH